MEELVAAILEGNVDHVKVYSVPGKDFEIVTVVGKDGEWRHFNISKDVYKSENVAQKLENLGVEIYFLLTT